MKYRVHWYSRLTGKCSYTTFSWTLRDVMFMPCMNMTWQYLEHWVEGDPLEETTDPITYY